MLYLAISLSVEFISKQLLNQKDIYILIMKTSFPLWKEPDISLSIMHSKAHSDYKMIFNPHT